MNEKLLSDKIGKFMQIMFRNDQKNLAEQFIEVVGKDIFENFAIPSTSFSFHYPDYKISTSAIALFGYPTKDTEFGEPPLSLKWVYYGVKPMALLYSSNAEIMSLLHWARKHGLTGVLSSYVFNPPADNSLNGYSNIVEDMHEASNARGGWRGLLVSRDIDLLALGWVALSFCCDNLLGSLLGYPACCVAEFDKNWEHALRYSGGDLSMLSLKKSKQLFHPLSLNIFGRYNGYEFLQHFPCKLNCSASVNLARKYEAVLRKYEPGTWREYSKQLSKTVLVHKKQGTFSFQEVSTICKGSNYIVKYDNKKVAQTGPVSSISSCLKSASEVKYDLKEGKVTINRQTFDALLAVFKK